MVTILRSLDFLEKVQGIFFHVYHDHQCRRIVVLRLSSDWPPEFQADTKFNLQTPHWFLWMIQSRCERKRRNFLEPLRKEKWMICLDVQSRRHGSWLILCQEVLPKSKPSKKFKRKRSTNGLVLITLCSESNANDGGIVWDQRKTPWIARATIRCTLHDTISSWQMISFPKNGTIWGLWNTLDHMGIVLVLSRLYYRTLGLFGMSVASEFTKSFFMMLDILLIRIHFHNKNEKWNDNLDLYAIGWDFKAEKWGSMDEIIGVAEIFAPKSCPCPLTFCDFILGGTSNLEETTKTQCSSIPLS